MLGAWTCFHHMGPQVCVQAGMKEALFLLLHVCTRTYFMPCVVQVTGRMKRTQEKDAKAFPTRSHKHVRWLKGLLSIPHLVRTLRSSTIVPSPRSKLGLWWVTFGSALRPSLYFFVNSKLLVVFLVKICWRFCKKHALYTRRLLHFSCIFWCSGKRGGWAYVGGLPLVHWLLALDLLKQLKLQVCLLDKCSAWHALHLLDGFKLDSMVKVWWRVYSCGQSLKAPLRWCISAWFTPCCSGIDPTE